MAAKRNRRKDLAPVDHSKAEYEPFRKAFYTPPYEVSQMTEEEVELMRLEMDGIKIRGVDCPRPVKRWGAFGLPAGCLEIIKRLGYAAPTAIQAQAIPAIMSGRDVIGVAKTGSGKTIAFLLPLLRHIKDQRPLQSGEGPMAVVMTPTRELALQIVREAKPFCRVLNITVRSLRCRLPFLSPADLFLSFSLPGHVRVRRLAHLGADCRDEERGRARRLYARTHARPADGQQRARDQP
jgi:ATP-dependent RNA helicase DDX46/PRP5